MGRLLAALALISLCITGCGILGGAADLLFGTSPGVDAAGNPTPGGGGLLQLFAIGGPIGAGIAAAGNVIQHLRGRNWKGAALATAAGVEEYMKAMSPEEKAKLATTLSLWQESASSKVRDFVAVKVLPSAKAMVAADS